MSPSGMATTTPKLMYFFMTIVSFISWELMIGNCRMLLIAARTTKEHR